VLIPAAGKRETGAAPARIMGAVPTTTRRPRPAGSLWTKVLLVFGVGCSAVLALGLLLAGLAVYWTLWPGSQLETVSIVGPEPVAVVHVPSLAADEGVGGAIEHLAEEIGRQHEARTMQPTPAWLRRLGFRSGGPPPGLLKAFLPEEATLVVERPRAEEAPHWALAVNFRRLVRPARALFEAGSRQDRAWRILRRNGRRVAVGRHDGTSVCFHGGTLLVADSLAEMERVLERVGAGDLDREPRLPEDLPDLRGGWDVAGVLFERGDDLRATLDLFDVQGMRRARVEELLSGSFELVALGVDWETTDRIRARIAVQALDDLGLDDWMDRIERGLADLAATLARDELTLERRVDLHGRVILIELDLEGVEAAIERLARSL
jgi:hypothetical protein